MLSESALMTPKAIALFYIEIAKACSIFTGSKRIACGVVAFTSGMALIPGPHQGPFIVAYAAAARSANK